MDYNYDGVLGFGYYLFLFPTFQRIEFAYVWLCQSGFGDSIFSAGKSVMEFNLVIYSTYPLPN